MLMKKCLADGIQDDLPVRTDGLQNGFYVFFFTTSEEQED